MLRHLSIALISALLGSALGTVIWTIQGGGVGALFPVRFTVGLAVATLGFTIAGAAMLMAATLALASRDVSVRLAAFVLIGLGVSLGAAMLALFSPYMMLIGAMFGGITAMSFTGLLWLLRAYPRNSR